MENMPIECPQCRRREDGMLILICSVCGERFCTACASWETPNMCEYCEYEKLYGEE